MCGGRTPEVPASWEVETRGSLKLEIFKTVWATQGDPVSRKKKKGET